MTVDDPGVESTVRERIRTCLQHGARWRLGTDLTTEHREGEGEVTRSLDRADLVDAVESDDGTTRYTFEATVHEEIASKGPPPAEPVTRSVDLTGHIVLDENLDLTFDERGQVRFEPGPVVHPRFWSEDVDDPARPDGGRRNSHGELWGERNPVRWRPGRVAAVRTAVETRLAGRGTAMVVAGPDLERQAPGEFEAAMHEVANDLTAAHVLEGPGGSTRVDAAVFRRLEEERP